MLSGLVNPLLLIYLLFCIWPRFVGVRRVMCVAILVCMVGPWAYFHLEHFLPLIGHYLWVSGIVIILAGGFVGRFEKGAQG